MFDGTAQGRKSDFRPPLRRLVDATRPLRLLKKDSCRVQNEILLT